MNVSASLLQHIRGKLVSELSGNPRFDVSTSMTLAEAFVKAIVEDVKFAVSNKSIMETGTKLSKALKIIDVQTLMQEPITIELVLSILNKYDAYVQSNNTVYSDIINHHTNIVHEDWTTVASDHLSLAKYSAAAAVMGEKRWVVECNQWMENFAVRYFRNGGARKHYLKRFFKQDDSSAKAEHVNINNRDKRIHAVAENEWSVEQKQWFVDSLAKDLMSAAVSLQEKASQREDEDAYSKIRLLDVGSCYNPIGRSTDTVAVATAEGGVTVAAEELFEVTALDLYPAHPSVLQCDFLQLAVGAPGSAPVIVDAAADHAANDSNYKTQIAVKDTGNDSNSEPGRAEKRQKTDKVNSTPATSDPTSTHSKHLRQLPAASFDAVTMSLVLSYLPTPEQRLQMIRTARALLVSPPPSLTSQSSNNIVTATESPPAPPPHRTGLLLIAEKESIFGKDGSSREGEHCVETVGFNKSVLLTNWKQAIINEGFTLVKYQLLKMDNHKSHVFAFATSNNMVNSTFGAHLNDSNGSVLDSNGKSSSAMSKDGVKMWIKQDFDSNVTSTGAVAKDDEDDIYVADNNFNAKYFDTSNLSRRPIGIVGGGMGGCALGKYKLQSENAEPLMCLLCLHFILHIYIYIYLRIHSHSVSFLFQRWRYRRRTSPLLSFATIAEFTERYDCIFTMFTCFYENVI